MFFPNLMSGLLLLLPNAKIKDLYIDKWLG